MEPPVDDTIPDGCSCHYKIAGRIRRREPNPRCTAEHNPLDEVVEHLLDQSL